MPSIRKRSNRVRPVSIRHCGRETRLSVTVPRFDSRESVDATVSLRVFAELLRAQNQRQPASGRASR